MSTHQLRSAGGVLIAVVNGTAYTVVLHQRSPDEWRLPKGKLRPGETPREAAAREVEEETGITARPRERLGEIQYQYIDPETNQQVHKQVVFYLMPVAEAKTIDIESKTFDQGLWMSANEAQTRLTFAAERRIVQAALSRLGN